MKTAITESGNCLLLTIDNYDFRVENLRTLRSDDVGPSATILWQFFQDLGIYLVEVEHHPHRLFREQSEKLWEPS